MSVIVDIDLEAGNLTEFTSTSTNGGKMSAAAGAALAGTSYGLQFVISNTTTMYGMVDLAPSDTSGKLRFRFYLDPNGLTMANSDLFTILGTYNSSSSGLAVVELYYTTGGGYQIRAKLNNDANSFTSTSSYAITDAPHYIECYLQRATNNGSSDGSLQLWIDGTSKETISGIDNYDKFVNFDKVYWCADQIDAGTSGTFFMDQLIINNDGSEIGPVVSGPTYTLAVDSGGYTLTGQTSAMLYGRKLDAGAGAYTLTGQNATLLYGRRLDAASGSYTLTGQDAKTLHGFRLDAASGNYTLTGQAVALLRGYRLDAASGVYALNGQDVTLIYSPLGAYTLVCESGSYTLTGQNTGLLAGRTMPAASGSYTLTGQDAGLLKGYRLDAASGAYSLTGQDTALLVNRVLAANPGAYVLTGQAVTLTYTPVGGFVTPAERIFIIVAENRIYFIPAENRVNDIPAESRIYSILKG